LRMKRDPTMMKMIKKNTQITPVSRLGTRLTALESTPLHMTSIHPSVVDISNKDTIELITLSKLESFSIQSPP
jgi:hypothetical protein